MGDTFAVHRALDPACLVIEEAQVVLHKPHQPDLVFDLVHADLLSRESLAQVDLVLSRELHVEGLVRTLLVEGVDELIEPCLLLQEVPGRLPGGVEDGRA